ncbi:helix-turn-helix domain-containing protein [Streptomyces sp. SBT349]|uniref:helix-turn-helix domain-containing protein n=1 Tax=Streptomyces sp. SBT349 TaxID=1580539 RepID=UPI00066C80B9|nr:helix-turn-helix transcriptional regulator [Streptomyces sp. SBT349]
MAEMYGTPWSLERMEVGGRMQELRDRSGLTLSQVVRHPVLSQRGVKLDTAALSRLEHGQRGITREVAEALLECYSAGQGEREEILALLAVDTTRRRRPALWRRHSALLTPMQFEGYLTLEQRASRMRNYEPAVVQGLLQTPDYARHVIESMRPDLTSAQVRGLVDVRLDRQRKVEDGALTEFHALIDEGALRRLVGTPAVMRGQFEHLLATSGQDRNTVRILPDIGCHPGLAGPFVLMDLPTIGREVREAVWIETMDRSLYLEDPVEVDRYAAVFLNLWQRALTPDDTRARLKCMIKESQ